MPESENALPANLSGHENSKKSRTITVRRPRVLVVVRGFPELSETFVFDHVAGLARRGFDTYVAASKPDPEYFHRRVGQNADDIKMVGGYRGRKKLRRYAKFLYRHPSLLFDRFARDRAAFADSLRTVIQDIRPDIIHTHFGTNGVSAALAASRDPVPILVNFHGFDFTTLPKKFGWHTYRKTLNSRPHTHAIAHSDFAEKSISEQLTIPIHRIRLGVDTALFNPPPKRTYWNEAIELLLVGRLEWIKGQHTAIEALAVARANDPKRKYRLTVVGDGPTKTQLQSYTKRLGLNDVVTFTGGMHPAQVADQMRASDMLLVPSQPSPRGWRETFGRVVIEGMSTGLPVIGTPIGGLPSTIGTAGILADGTDALSIADAINATLFRTPEEWLQVTRSRAEQFSIENMWNDYEALTNRATAHYN